MPLTDLQLNKNCRIEAIVPENSDILSYLAERKLWPGTELTLIAAAPLEGPLTLLIGEDEIVIGLNLAERILVNQG
jgi:DtxR family Mn-dependent transcriptional regulator